jgi:hypothetical protein
MTRIGSALLVGTVARDGTPRATRGWSLELVDEEARRLRLVVSADDQVTLQNLGNGRIAVTGGDVRTVRSQQVKGRVECIEEATEQDLARMALHADVFFTDVEETDGTPRSLLTKLLPIEVVACEFVVDEAYDQSPGPTAGSPRAVAS